jgi:aminoglycoside phosphotransferase (APT) family kinase protein
MTGRVPVSRPPYAESGWVAEASPAQRARLWENAVRMLARIHRLPLDEFRFLEGPPAAPSGLEQEWDKYVRFVEWISAEHRWPILDAALANLRERWPGNRPAGLVWGGAEMVNMMFDEDFGVVAVMDWEQPSLGGPLNDLAWWLTMADMKHGPGSGRPPLAGMGSRDETIALWSDATGMKADNIDWYEDFMALKLRCLSVSTARVWGIAPPDQSSLARRLNLKMTR